MRKNLHKFIASLTTTALLLPLVSSVAYANPSDAALGGTDLILPGYVDEKFADKEEWSITGASASITDWGTEFSDPENVIDGQYGDDRGWYTQDNPDGSYITIDFGEKKEISYFEAKARGKQSNYFDNFIGEFDIYVTDTAPVYNGNTIDTSSLENVTPINGAFFASGKEPSSSFDRQIFRFDSPEIGRYITLHLKSSNKVYANNNSMCVVEMDFGTWDYKRYTETISGKTYYVDSENGDDESDGLSQTNAWRTFNNITENLLKPGDKLLLKAGSKWNTPLLLKGNGVEGYPIIVDKYGEGDKPQIVCAGEPAAVSVIGQYWEVSNLDIQNWVDGDPLTNFGGAYYGVHVTTDGPGEYKHIYLRDLDVHDINNQDTGNRSVGGIVIDPNGTEEQKSTNDPSWYNEVIIENCTVKDVGRVGIHVGGYWVNRLRSDYNWESWWEPITWGIGRYKANLGVEIRNNHVENINGDGIFITTCHEALIEYNTVIACNGKSHEPNAAVWPHNCTNTLIQYNAVYNTKNTGDGQAFDDDFNCEGSIFQYNYSQDNEGGFMLIMPNTKNVTVRYNISQNDDRIVGAFDNRSQAAHIYNNTFYLKNGNIDRAVGGGTGGSILTNNLFYAESPGTSTSAWGRMSYNNNAYYNFANIPDDPAAITSNPLLAKPGSGDKKLDSVEGYRPLESSPLINAAITIDDNGGRDYYGSRVENNILDEAQDIGAIDTITEGESTSPLQYDKNYALGATVTGTGESLEGYGWFRQNIVDGNHNTGYHSGDQIYDPDAQATLEIHLKESSPVGRIIMYASSFPADFTVSTKSGDDEWIVRKEEINFDSETGRLGINFEDSKSIDRIKIDMTKLKYLPGEPERYEAVIQEVEAYGYVDTTSLASAIEEAKALNIEALNPSIEEAQTVLADDALAPSKYILAERTLRHVMEAYSSETKLELYNSIQEARTLFNDSLDADKEAKTEFLAGIEKAEAVYNNLNSTTQELADAAYDLSCETIVFNRNISNSGGLFIDPLDDFEKTAGYSDNLIVEKLNNYGLTNTVYMGTYQEDSFVTYHLDREMTGFEIGVGKSVFYNDIVKDLGLKIFISENGTTYTEIEPDEIKMEADGYAAFDHWTYMSNTLPQGSKYLKLQYPNFEVSDDLLWIFNIFSVKIKTVDTTATIESSADTVEAGQSVNLTFKVMKDGEVDSDYTGESVITISDVVPDGDQYGSFGGRLLTEASVTGQKVKVQFDKGMATVPVMLKKAQDQTLCFEIAGVKNSYTHTLKVTQPDVPEDTYNITVKNGNADKTEAKKGETVTITANAAQEGKVFDKWTSTDGIAFADETAVSTTFVMPEKNVTVTATYKEKQEISITNISDISKEYDGAAVLEPTFETDGTGAVTIEYKLQSQEESEYTAERPVNAGDYVVRISVAEGDGQKAASVTQEFYITAKEVMVDVTVKDKQYDGQVTAEIENAELTGVVEGDEVTLMNGVPAFTTAEVSEQAAVVFTDFMISGADAINYTLIQPKGITAKIFNDYEAKAGTDYTVNTNDWTNQDFTVQAKEGYQLSLTNTAEGEWLDVLVKSEETADGTLTFYVKNTESSAISKVVTEHYQIDKTVPTGEVEIGENSWKEFLNSITFDLFFKETMTVKITGEDKASGIAKTEYYESGKALELAEVKGLKDSDWKEGSSVDVTAEDAKKFVYYARITDQAGNVTYVSSDGAEFDLTAPELEGVENGMLTCEGVTFTATDDHLASVSVNGQLVSPSEDGTYSIAGDNDNPRFTVTATDQAGNETTCVVTVFAGHEFTEYVPNDDATTSQNATETAACNHGCGETHTREIPGTQLKKEGSITNISDISKQYDGMPVSVPTFDTTGSGNVTIEYRLKSEDESAYTTEAPIKEGEYELRIRVDEDEQYEEVSAEKEFRIYNDYEAKAGTDYTVNTNDWTNQDFTVQAKEGYQLSLTNTAEGEWLDVLAKSEETADGTLTFYVKNTESSAISKVVTEHYQIDKTVPTGEVEIGENSWKELLNSITFDLFFKETMTVKITGKDEASGIAKTEYYESGKALELAEVKALKDSDWKEGSSVDVTAEDAKKFVYYARITDQAGNVTYVSSDGAEFDLTAPELEGVENGMLTCEEVTFTVSDDHLASVSVNGQLVSLSEDGTYSIAGDNDNPRFTVTAADQAGNETTCVVTVFAGHEFIEYVSDDNASMLQNATETAGCEHGCGSSDTREVPNTKYEEEMETRPVLEEETGDKGGKISVNVNQDQDMSKVVIRCTADQVKTWFPKEDLDRVDAGESALVYLDGRNINDTVSEEEKELVHKRLKQELKSGKAGLYFDLSLYRKIGDEPAVRITDTGKGQEIHISMEIPEELRTDDPSIERSYYVVRVHSGAAEIIPAVYEEEGYTIQFETGLFSTYALAYMDEVTEPGTDDGEKPGTDDGEKPETDGNVPGSQDNEQPDDSKEAESTTEDQGAPDTGDKSNVSLWMFMIMVSIVTIGIWGKVKIYRK